MTTHLNGLTGTSNHATVVQNTRVLGHLMIHFPTSSEVSERMSERMSAAERASEAIREEQVNE